MEPNIFIYCLVTCDPLPNPLDFKMNTTSAELSMFTSSSLLNAASVCIVALSYLVSYIAIKFFALAYFNHVHPFKKRTHINCTWSLPSYLGELYQKKPTKDPHHLHVTNTLGWQPRLPKNWWQSFSFRLGSLKKPIAILCQWLLSTRPGGQPNYTPED